MQAHLEAGKTPGEPPSAATGAHAGRKAEPPRPARGQSGPPDVLRLLRPGLCMGRSGAYTRGAMAREMPFDMDFRPAWYWAEADAVRLANIHGTVRKQMLREQLAGPAAAEIPPQALRPELSEEDRRTWGAMHPAFMGGEYLPRSTRGSVEIARVEVASVTWDVISVRARMLRGKIRYRVVDEYETKFRCDPQVSDLPLTMGELIHLMDTAKGLAAPGITLAFQLSIPADKPEALLKFVTVSSEFYPALRDWYRVQFERWAASRRAALVAAGRGLPKPTA